MLNWVSAVQFRRLGENGVNFELAMIGNNTRNRLILGCLEHLGISHVGLPRNQDSVLYVGVSFFWKQRKVHGAKSGE